MDGLDEALAVFDAQIDTFNSRSLAPAHVELALKKLAEIRRDPVAAVGLARYASDDDRARLDAKLDEVEAALRRHLGD